MWLQTPKAALNHTDLPSRSADRFAPRWDPTPVYPGEEVRVFGETACRWRFEALSTLQHAGI